MALSEENGLAGDEPKSLVKISPNSTMTYRSPQLATSSSSASSAALSFLPPSSSTTDHESPMDLDTFDDLFCPPDEVSGACACLGFWDNFYEKILGDDFSRIRFYMAIGHQVEFMISANDKLSIFLKRLNEDDFKFHSDRCTRTVGCNIFFLQFIHFLFLFSLIMCSMT